jgi:hypothetical protein
MLEGAVMSEDQISGEVRHKGPYFSDIASSRLPNSHEREIIRRLCNFPSETSPQDANEATPAVGGNAHGGFFTVGNVIYPARFLFVHQHP